MAQRKDGGGKKECDVKGCSEEAVRSLSAKKIHNAGLDIPEGRGNAHLCKDHYKDYKRSTKEDRKLQRLGW